MKLNPRGLFIAIALALPLVAFAQQPPVSIIGLLELSGTGATSGTNFDNGVKLAIKEINAAGGILGRQIDYATWDTQTNPGVAKALAKKASDQGVYVVMGPVFSGSILVSMTETQRAEITKLTGGEAPLVTRQGNPYIFRTSITLGSMFPKLARYINGTVKAKTVAIIYGNDDAGKGARDAARKSLEAVGVKVLTDISTEPGQVDFSSAVLLAKRSEAGALVVYVNEEEAARLLRALKSMSYDKPVLGATVLVAPSVIKLAGDSANGAIGVVDLAAAAPQASLKGFHQRFTDAYKYTSDHNGIKGYTGMYIVKAMTERVGKFDSKALAKALHGAKISAKDYPGVLLDVVYDDAGDLDRESFLIKVQNGEQVVIAALPADGGK